MSQCLAMSVANGPAMMVFTRTVGPYAFAKPTVSPAISAAVSSQVACLRLEMTMSAPASANPIAMARPRPRLPPVTSATLPASEKSVVNWSLHGVEDGGGAPRQRDDPGALAALAFVGGLTTHIA